MVVKAMLTKLRLQSYAYKAMLTRSSWEQEMSRIETGFVRRGSVAISRLL